MTCTSTDIFEFSPSLEPLPPLVTHGVGNLGIDINFFKKFTGLSFSSPLLLTLSKQGQGKRISVDGARS